jgi:hypothetical protein
MMINPPHKLHPNDYENVEPTSTIIFSIEIRFMMINPPHKLHPNDAFIAIFNYNHKNQSNNEIK